MCVCVCTCVLFLLESKCGHGCGLLLSLCLPLSLSLSPGLPSFSLSFSFTSLFSPPLSLPLILYPTLPLFNSSTALQLLVAMMEAMAPAPSLTRLTHGHNAPTQTAGPTTIMMSVIRSVTMLHVFMTGETARFYYPLVLQSKRALLVLY